MRGNGGKIGTHSMQWERIHIENGILEIGKKKSNFTGFDGTRWGVKETSEGGFFARSDSWCGMGGRYDVVWGCPRTKGNASGDVRGRSGMKILKSASWV